MCRVAIVCGRMRQEELVFFTMGTGIGTKNSYFAVFEESFVPGTFTVTKVDNSRWELPDILRLNCKLLSDIDVDSDLVRSVWGRDSIKLYAMIACSHEELMVSYFRFRYRIDSSLVIVSPVAKRRKEKHEIVEARAMVASANRKVLEDLTECCDIWAACRTPVLQHMSVAMRPHLSSMVADELTSLLNPMSVTFNISSQVYDGKRLVRMDMGFMKAYNKLLSDHKLPKLTKFQKEQCMHIGVITICDGKLVAGMSFLFACVKNLPVRVAVSIELTVSLGEFHGASLIWEALMKNLKRRKSPKPCIVVAQCAFAAERFWNGKMTSSTKSCGILMMFARLSSSYKIYNDVNNKILYV